MSPPGSILDDPEHWRRRAEEARTVAQQTDDPQAKAMMMRARWRGSARLAARTSSMVRGRRQDASCDVRRFFSCDDREPSMAWP
jgi:hypothetical protein